MTLYSYVAPYSSAAALAFEGNPNRTISAINTSGGIVCSRTSGQTPCFIQASASAITATGTDLPYEDLSYFWDFGDGDSAETFTNPGVGGGTVNSNDDQTGPEAVHCYRTAGTYTITLTIRGKNGSSPFVATTVTQQITVTTFSASGGEYWVDSVGGSDSNDGLSIGAPKQTISAAITAMGVSNRHVHIKRGSSFAGTTTFELLANAPSPAGASGLRVDAYGTGDDPVIDITSGTNRALYLRNGGGGSPAPKSDVVVSGLHFKNSGTAAHTGYLCTFGATGSSDASALVSHIYLDNCTLEVTTQGSVLQSSGSPRLSKTGFWNCIFKSPATNVADSFGLFAFSMEWTFVYGGYFEGGSASGGIEKHHIYPDIRYHSAFRWIDFRAGEERVFCINLNWDQQGASLEYAEYHLIADCNLAGVKRGYDYGNGPPDETQSLFRNTVVQGCKFNLIGNGQQLPPCVETHTNRDNEVVIAGATVGRWFEPVASRLGGILSAKLYRNKFYIASDGSADNVIAYTSALWTVHQEITDNIFQDMRTGGRTIAIPFTQQTGAIIDRNQYYAPNDSDGEYFFDVATSKSFAEWQAAGFDVNGSVADPGWTDPANGDFS